MVILESKKITKRFAGLLAVGHVDFRLQKGEILGLIGPNGAGKTTLVNVIAGVYAPSDGAVFFKGRQISGKKPYEIGRMGISRTFQVVKPFPGMTVKENAAVGAMYGAGGKNKSAKEAILRAEQILELVGLADQMNKGADQLSVASRKRLEMAKALAMEPEVVLFDEVMAGLNFGEIDQAVELIKRIRAGGMSILIIEHVKAINQQGTSVLLVEQDVQLALDNSHYGYVLSTGRVEMEGNSQELLRNREIKEIYLGV